MNPKAVAVGLVLVAAVWGWLAFQSYLRGKLGLCAVEVLAGLAFAGRGVYEWRKASG